MFDFNDYQTRSRKTWNLIHTDHPIVYPTLGLVNEAGELAGKVKKIFRDKGGVISEADRDALKYELGDVLWYMAQIATELDLTLEEVAAANLEKLFLAPGAGDDSGRRGCALSRRGVSSWCVLRVARSREHYETRNTHHVTRTTLS